MPIFVFLNILVKFETTAEQLYIIISNGINDSLQIHFIY